MKIKPMFSNWLRLLFFACIVRPLTWVVLGINIRHQARLPQKGPAIIVANHNSHLDTLVLMSLFPLKQLPQLRPVAAADYFLRNRIVAWFALKIIGIIPITRHVKKDQDPFADIYTALSKGSIIILFPEGTRGEPERMSKFKNGVARLGQHIPDVPTIPIFLHGLGKALPKGEAVFVPFFCDVFVGEPFKWQGGKHEYMQHLDQAMQKLANEGQFATWE